MPPLRRTKQSSNKPMNSASSPPPPFSAWANAIANRGSPTRPLPNTSASFKDSPDLINAKDTSGSHRTPLHLAAESGYLSGAQLQLANRAQDDALDSIKRNPT